MGLEEKGAQVVEERTIIFYEDQLIAVRVDVPPEWQTFKRAQAVKESGPVQREMDL